MKITVRPKSWDATTGTLEIGEKPYDCTLGRAGVVWAREKKEGDGKTPLGTYPMRQLLYRADRVKKPETGLPLEVITPETGWCEDPDHPDYNKKVLLPHVSVHDRMMREDNLYDYTVVIGYNDGPIVPGKGSAIFMHIARKDFGPTAGCVGLRFKDMLDVLKLCDNSTIIDIQPPL